MGKNIPHTGLKSVVSSKWFRWGIVSVICLVALSFVESRQKARTCKEIRVRIMNQHDNFFIKKNEVQNLLTKSGSDTIIGQSFDNIHLKSLEKRLTGHEYIKRAELFRDLRGNMVAKIYQNQPIARILQENSPEAYISEDGRILPVSENYTARVMLISGAYADSLINYGVDSGRWNKQIYNMVTYINNHDFWKPQIAQLNISGDGEIKLYPQVGKQTVIFGKPENYEKKFDKLDIFYNKILPNKGWNYYNQVNLKYKDQIICE